METDEDAELVSRQSPIPIQSPTPTTLASSISLQPVDPFLKEIRLPMSEIIPILKSRLETWNSLNIQLRELGIYIAELIQTITHTRLKDAAHLICFCFAFTTHSTRKSGHQGTDCR
jgi:hypothetical protein